MGNAILYRKAVIDGDFENFVQYLEVMENTVDMKFQFESTPLHLACQYNHILIVNELLKRGAFTNAKDTYNGYSPLHWASEGGYTMIIDALIAKNADVNMTVGVNQSFSDTHLGSTPMHLACSYGRTAAALRLISAGADMNIRDREGR